MRFTFRIVLFPVGAGLAALLTGCSQAQSTRVYESVDAPQERRGVPSLAEQYRARAERIVEAALAANDAYRKLEAMCLDIGHRLSGSPQLEQAIDWAVEAMKRDGHENVRKEPVTVPHWVRGHESAVMISPRDVRLHILGLGGSVGAPPEGVTAPVVVVESEEELDALADEVRGKMVLFNRAMPPYDPRRGSGYGTAARYRVHGARLAAERGAVACLVRSATANSLRSPHTGGMRYADGVPRIPAAAVSLEDAEMIARLYQRGTPVVVNLKMAARFLGETTSANVIGELRGHALPDEVVVIGGHIDSWDVGQGAHDDAGGCVTAMEAISVLRRLGLIPRRTIRVVLWTNEENGLGGARAYAREHADELDRHVAAIEMDSGVFAPRGYSIECADKEREAVAAEQLRNILRVFDTTIGTLDVRIGGSGADLSPMRPAGVILMGHRVEGSRYFDYHHTHADTIDKIDPEELSRNVAVMAATAFILADMPARFGEIP